MVPSSNKKQKMKSIYKIGKNEKGFLRIKFNFCFVFATVYMKVASKFLFFVSLMGNTR